ncbi:MAG: T9SS type A sorting domain-containing protein [Bacteroidota bacterium]
MKSKYILFSALAVSLGTAAIYKSFNAKTTEESYQPRMESPNLLMGHARSAAGAFEYYKSIKSNVNTGNIELSDLINSQVAVKQHANQKGSNGEDNMTWQSMGPDNQGGRTYAILFEKSNPNTIFAGAVSGGLWKTTTGGTSWLEVGDFENNNISCIHQAANGDMYFGTGEDIGNADGSGNSAFMGQGIWKSTDKGATWSHLPATLPINTNNPNIEFSFISEITTSPSDANVIYVATNRGVRKSIDGGETWTNPMIIVGGGASPIIGQGYNVDIASDGTIICDVNSKVYMSFDGGETFENQSIKSGATNPNKIPSSGIGRMSIDVAPSDANYFYVQCSSPNGGAGFEGIYRTTNKGTDWSLYVPGKVSGFNIFTQDPSEAVAASHQGWYDNVIKVHPTDKDKIYCGGIDVWSFSPTTSFERISMWFGEGSETFVNPYYVHADQHGIAFHPTNPDIILFVGDGGIFKTENGGLTFKEINKGYATTQFYEMCFGPTGEVMGGLQDNGTQYIDFHGNTLRAAKEVKGGDGFDSEISQIDENVFFATSYNGDIGRSAKKGAGFSPFYNNRAQVAMNNSPFHTKMAMWETKKAENFNDTVYFTTTVDITAETIINQTSKTTKLPITWIADKDYPAGSRVGVPDPIQNRFVVAGNNSVWMTCEAMNFTTNPKWFRIATNTITSTPGQGANDALSGASVVSFAFSTSGEHLFLGDAGGSVYRVSYLNTIKNNNILGNDTLTGELGNSKCKLTLKRIGNFGRIVTSLAVDPQNADNLVVTLGNYGSTGSYVYKSSNATIANSASNATTNFTDIQGDLPKMPVYASIIDYQNPDVIVLGTEYGIYSSSVGGLSWSARNTGMGKVGVFSLRQQTLAYNECWNSGVMYAGTHGKGIYKSDALVSIKGNASKTVSPLELKVYPNPVTESASINFSIEKTREIAVTVYDLNGRVVKSFDLDKKPEGTHQFTFSAEDLNIGTYIVSVNGGNDYKKVTKFVVVK